MTIKERLTTLTSSEESEIQLPKIYFDFLWEKTEDFLHRCRKYQLHVDEYGSLIDKNNKIHYCAFDYYGYLAFAKTDYCMLNPKNQEAFLKLKAEINEVVKH